MQLNRRSLPDDEESISLLTTLLVRYPEVCTINYTPKGRLLKLSLIIKGRLGKKDFEIFQEEIIDCISTYIYFENKDQPEIVRVKYDYAPGITIIEISRDTRTLTQRELALMINYMQERFGAVLVSDNLHLHEDDQIEQDDFIRYMLDKIKNKCPKNPLIAMREEGRVLVFKR